MREIGGYFGLELFSGQEYHNSLIAVNNGRNALLYLLKARKISKLYIPYFLCDSISVLLEKNGYDYAFYHISADFLPICDRTFSGDEYLYVVNYYGQLTNDMLSMLKRKHGNIIVDNIQAFFQKPAEGIDTIYTCRKFFGVPDGGYVSTTAELCEPLLLDVSKDRMYHVLGRFEGIASDYYKDYQKSESLHEEFPLSFMSELTHNLLRAIDYEVVRNKRNENFALLAKELGHLNKLQLISPDGPYAYPFYCENGLEIKKWLAANKVYVPTLWPNVLELDGTLEKDYAENILPLPCDQRYDVKDMTRMVEEILSCIN